MMKNDNYLEWEASEKGIVGTDSWRCLGFTDWDVENEYESENYDNYRKLGQT